MPNPPREMLPRQVDPRKLVAQEAILRGGVPASSMTRLAQEVVEVAEDARAELTFSRDDYGNATVAGQFEMAVDLRCQRCLEPVRYDLAGECRLGLVWNDEQASKLPASLDPWVVEEYSADLHVLIEDELILALPIVAFHREEECAGSTSYSTGSIRGEERNNPFDVLETLKKKP